MELLEMLDTVFDWLKTNSDKDPDFSAIKEGLKDYKLDDGEIDDCLKKLHKDGYLYFMDNKKENQKSDVAGEIYHRGYNYLITFDGKFFLKTVGGYQKKNANDLQKIANEEAVTQRMEKSAQDLVTWTQNLATRTQELRNWTKAVAIGALGLVVWEVIAFALEHHWFSCR